MHAHPHTHLWLPTGSFCSNCRSMDRDQTKRDRKTRTCLSCESAIQVPKGLGFACVGVGVSGVSSFVGYQP